MTDKDVTQMRVGEFSAGIVGLRSLMEEMARNFSRKSNEELKHHMLKVLEKSNYIPGSAREDYGRAFVREFRKFMGQPIGEEAKEGMEIKVLGPGCFQCDNLEKTLMEVLSEIEMPASVEHVQDMGEIASYGIMGVPALLINGKVVATGSVPPRRKIREWLLAARSSGQ